MILTENIVIIFIVPRLFPHKLHINSPHGFSAMVIAMVFGFLSIMIITILKRLGKSVINSNLSKQAFPTIFWNISLKQYFFVFILNLIECNNGVISKIL